MTRCVLDASVAAKWFLPASGETLTEEALRLLEGYVKGDTRFLVPDLFWPEFGNILWKAVRLGRISRESRRLRWPRWKREKSPPRRLHPC